jgi:hypothetical protein
MAQGSTLVESTEINVVGKSGQISLGNATQARHCASSAAGMAPSC